MRIDRRARAALVAVAAGLSVAAAGCGTHGGTIRIGVISDCDGGFAFAFQGDLAGADLPLLDRGGKLSGAQPADGVEGAKVAGKRVQLIVGCQHSTRASMVAVARRLVERDGVAAVMGTQGSLEGPELRDYARRHPGVTFLYNGLDQATTLKSPAPNVFRFRGGNPQWAGGLGAYAYWNLGWRRVVTVGEDDWSGWAGMAGFVAEFCSLGGDVVQQLWQPAGNQANFAPLVARIPATGVDGVVIGDGLFDTHSLVVAWHARHPDLAKWLVGEDNLLSENTSDPDLQGVVSVNVTPWAATPAWRRYLADLARKFPGRQIDPQAAIDYYDSMEALLEAIEQVHGDLSHGERALMAALARRTFDSPEGPRRLDASHQAVITNYVGELQRDAAGKLVVRQVGAVHGIEQTFGGYFTSTSRSPSPTQPLCKRRTPPAWATHPLRLTR